jgi:HTH-type transcriptional regulator/antitoxin HigA
MNEVLLHTNNHFGSLLKEELKNRGISQKDFAETFGIKASNLSGILNGKRKIPVSLIPIVSELIGIEEAIIINAQKNFSNDTKTLVDDSQEDIKAKKELESFERIVSLKSLLKELSIKADSALDKLKLIKESYFLTSSEELATKLQTLSDNCFRRSDKTGLDNIMIATWVVKVRAMAMHHLVSNKFDKVRIPELISLLSAILHKNRNNTPKQIKDVLESFGIGYIEMPKESKASIDGYSFIINDTPYIALTRRFDRIDNYAFNIMHELGHICLGHVDDTGRINVAVPLSESSEAYPSYEEEANRFATEHLIPNNLWFLAPSVPLNPFVIQKRYTQWAKSKNLNPWIVLGRVSHETGMYRFTSDNTRKINIGKEGVSMMK